MCRHLLSEQPVGQEVAWGREGDAHWGGRWEVRSCSRGGFFPSCSHSKLSVSNSCQRGCLLSLEPDIRRYFHLVGAGWHSLESQNQSACTWHGLLIQTQKFYRLQHQILVLCVIPKPFLVLFAWNRASGFLLDRHTVWILSWSLWSYNCLSFFLLSWIQTDLAYQL